MNDSRRPRLNIYGDERRDAGESGGKEALQMRGAVATWRVQTLIVRLCQTHARTRLAWCAWRAGALNKNLPEDEEI